jgi:hypothetical protein
MITERSTLMPKSEQDFLASIRVLEGALRLYYSGLKDAYRVVATELRKVLCDRDPLLPRVRPGFRLHKLSWTEILEECPSLADGLANIMPGQLMMSDDGSSRFELTFAKSGTLMVPKDWVRQPFLSPSVTVWELIKSVADKEGAHSDPNFNPALIEAKLVRYVRDESHIPATLALGEYLFRWLHDGGAVST